MPVYRVDRSEIEKLKATWSEQAGTRKVSRASVEADRTRQIAAEERARKTAFSKSSAQGNAALETLALKLAGMRLSSDTNEVLAAQLYGTTLTLQRTAFALSTLLGEPYEQHLDAPASAPKASLTNLQLINDSIEESTKMMIRSINVLKLVLEGQAQASERINDIAALLGDEGVDERVLLSLAEGTSPASYAESLTRLVDDCRPVIEAIVKDAPVITPDASDKL